MGFPSLPWRGRNDRGGLAVKKTWFAILAITLVAFLLRVYRLDFVSLRGDEAFTVIFVQRTWDGLWKGIRTIEPNPPLMYLVLRVWVALVGAGEFVTRYFSAFFGVLCVPLLYRLAREMFSYHVDAAHDRWRIRCLAGSEGNQVRVAVTERWLRLSPLDSSRSTRIRYGIRRTCAITQCGPR